MLPAMHIGLNTKNSTYDVTAALRFYTAVVLNKKFPVFEGNDFRVITMRDDIIIPVFTVSPKMGTTRIHFGDSYGEIELDADIDELIDASVMTPTLVDIDEYFDHLINKYMKRTPDDASLGLYVNNGECELEAIVLVPNNTTACMTAIHCFNVSTYLYTGDLGLTFEGEFSPKENLTIAMRPNKEELNHGKEKEDG